jgi:hypothetical protein
VRRAPIAAVVLVALGATACGESATQKATAAAKEYVKKLGARDGKGACAQMTTGLQRDFTDTVTRTATQFRGKPCATIMQAALATIPENELRLFSNAQIRNVRLNDAEDGGTFVYRVGRINVDGRVAKENDEWKVSCCVPQAGGA